MSTIPRIACHRNMLLRHILIPRVMRCRGRIVFTDNAVYILNCLENLACSIWELTVLRFTAGAKMVLTM